MHRTGASSADAPNGCIFGAVGVSAEEQVAAMQREMLAMMQQMAALTGQMQEKRDEDARAAQRDAERHAGSAASEDADEPPAIGGAENDKLDSQRPAQAGGEPGESGHDQPDVQQLEPDADSGHAVEGQ